MGDEDFLAAVEADNLNAPVEEPTAEPEAATPVEPKAEPARDEKGKFAKAEEPATPPAPQQPEPTPEPVVAPEPPRQPDPGFVPLSAVLDERERRQKVEAENAQLRAAQQPAEVPDPDKDPVGFFHYQQAEFQKVLINERLNVSERFARKEHGAEAVEAAKEWAKQKHAADPFYLEQVKADADPYERLVSDYRRDQLFSQVSDPSEIEEFRAWKAAQGQLAQQQNGAPAPPQTPAPPNVPPRSLASAPSAGDVLTDPELTEQDIFEGVIPKG